MGYRVDYGPMDRAMRKYNYRVSGWPVLCAVFFLCFLVMVCSFWDEGREVLGRVLFPGDWAAVEDALVLFKEAAETGATAIECLEAFCSGIILEGTLDLR